MNGTVNPSAKTTDTFAADLTAAPEYNNIGNFVYDNLTDYSYVDLFTGAEKYGVYGLMAWQITAIIIDIIFAVLIVLLEVLVLKRFKANKIKFAEEIEIQIKG